MKTLEGKRIASILLALIFVLGLAAGAAFAEDALTPDIGKAAADSGDENFIQYRDNYALDTEKLSFFKDPMATVFDGGANALFVMQKGIATVQIYLFQIALESNVLELLEEFISPFIDSMRVYIFDSFSSAFIVICVVLLLLKLALNRHTQAISGFLQIVIILVLAFAFYNHPVEMMRVAGDVTEGVSDAVMEGPYNAVNGSGAATTSMEGKVSALVWNLMVHKPWQAAEFSSIDKARTYEKEILKHALESKERREVVERLAKEQGLFSKTLTHQLERIFTLLVLGILNLIIFVFLTAFCALIVGYQFLTLFYMLLGVFVFLLALIPYFGTDLVKRWTMMILSACGVKILLAFMLSILLVFMDAMYKFIDTKGLLFTLFMIIIIIMMIYLKRREILGLFTGFRASDLMTTPATYQTMNKALDKDYNVLHNFNTMRKHDARDYESPSLSSASKQSASAYSSMSSVGDFAKSSQETSVESVAAMKQAAGSITKSTQDMSRYFHKAEELLQRQYEKSKAEAEETADKSGSEAEYGNFVRRTNSVRTLGAGKFDQRDISSVARILQRVEKSGGDMDQVIAESKNDLSREVKRPVNLFDTSANNKEPVSGLEGSAPAMNQKVMKQGIDYFKDNFGAEKGEEFFAAMSDKFDPMAVYSFSSNEKLTYAQVQRQLKEREKEAKQSSGWPVEKEAKRRTVEKDIKQKPKERQPVKMTKPGEEHGNQEK